MVEYYASYIPTILGANQFRDQHIEIATQRYKYFKKLGIITDIEIDKLMKMEDEYKKKFNSGVSKSKIALMKEEAEREGNIQGQEIINKLSKTVYGNFNEKTVIDRLLDEHNIEVTENNKEFFSLKYDDFYVKGKVDGFTYINKEKYLVEIKSRIGSFKEKIPFYELIQVTVLMKLTNTKKCLFVQSLRNFIKTKTIDFDEKLYEKIISKLHEITPLIKENDNEIFKKDLKKIVKIN